MSNPYLEKAEIILYRLIDNMVKLSNGKPKNVIDQSLNYLLTSSYNNKNDKKTIIL